jgi:hypothetical protein
VIDFRHRIGQTASALCTPHGIYLTPPYYICTANCTTRWRTSLGLAAVGEDRDYLGKRYREDPAQRSLLSAESPLYLLSDRLWQLQAGDGLMQGHRAHCVRRCSREGCPLCPKGRRCLACSACVWYDQDRVMRPSFIELLHIVCTAAETMTRFSCDPKHFCGP